MTDTIQEARWNSCSKFREIKEKLSIETVKIMKLRKGMLDNYTTNIIRLKQLEVS